LPFSTGWRALTIRAAGALRFIEDDPAGTMRAIGTAVDPNVLGGMMILVAALLGPQLVGKAPLFLGLTQTEVDKIGRYKL
jgi:hypothetical protein